ncbi:MAG TPA: bifunctional phosphopantothenoylcysteine decarboxylase/phosphopantothenate--cysteine ligase CoaBC [Thermomicrobiaceae bacterium]|nr:bifunctional phosphopantothenoylcysteine decarboxylase/phosphopantothenate--cysteine ligase CoaBC [Thermomicrobiaceae bacterium]
MTGLLRGKRIILGVSGGIAAYKAIELARHLTLAGALVDVMLTHAALEFVRPLPFETLTRRPVFTDVFIPWTEEQHGHISMADEADLMLVAPATANTIAKLANGLADDMLTVSALATTAPLLVAPAMDHKMYLHPATQANLETLQRRGVRIIGPERGPLASGALGYGRLVPVERILDGVRATLARGGQLQGRTAVVSAGPTREAIDPIRFLSNRSSGKMGYAIAQALLDAGAEVTLISGPTALRPPSEATLVPVDSARQMAEAVMAAVPAADILVMAAAVADYTPAQVAEQKIKKSEGELTLRLGRTLDILAAVERPGLIKVGFAAETTALLASADEKLRRKHLDLIVANDAVGTMGSDESRAYFLMPGHEPLELPPMGKDALAERLVEQITALLESTRDHAAAPTAPTA